ncbi:programmed cell death protein 1 [Anomaloglossus baeobatrachus]|uniref:programmed cell death protein 1 n=1 Tax=Anomaloglossus baeobatrachus TaxID=238106 RepID=UPI003F4FF689
MRMQRLSLITQSICVSIVLGDAFSGKNVASYISLFVQSPTRLCLNPGENASFTCNISALKSPPKDINWYKTNVKIADVKTVTQRRLYITINWNLREAKLHIVNVTFNDSGKYNCGYISESGGVIITSNEAELFVDSFPSAVTDKTSHQNVTENKSGSLKISIISTSVVLTLLLLLAIGSTIIFIWYKKRDRSPQPQEQDMEKAPQDPSVYTVNYGILEFGSRQPCRESPQLNIPEQVEYATIMFLPQTPSMGEKKGRSA